MACSGEGEQISSRKKPKILPGRQVIKKYVKLALDHPEKTIVFPTIVPNMMREDSLRAERVFKKTLKRVRGMAGPNEETGVASGHSDPQGAEAFNNTSTKNPQDTSNS